MNKPALRQLSRGPAPHRFPMTPGGGTGTRQVPATKGAPVPAPPPQHPKTAAAQSPDPTPAAQGLTNHPLYGNPGVSPTTQAGETSPPGQSVNLQHSTWAHSDEESQVLRSHPGDFYFVL